MSGGAKPSGPRDGIVAGVLLAGFGAWVAARALTTEGILEADEVAHWLYARHAPSNPMNLLQVWARPLYTAVLVPFAQKGFDAARLLSVVSAVLTAAFAWLACRRLGWKTAACAIPLAFAQPLFFQQSAGVWTEVTFAAFLGAWILTIASRRLTAAAFVAAALPLVRPEGVIVAVVTAFAPLSASLRAGPLKPALLRTLAILPCGVLLWAAAGFAASGDPLWLPHHWPPNWAPSASYGHGAWDWLEDALPEVVPRVLLPLLALGLLAPAIWTAWPIVACCASILAVHAVLWKLGSFGSAGYARYFVTLAPAFAVLMTGGVEIVARILRPVPAALWPGLLAGLAVFLLLRHPTATLRPPLPPDARLFSAVGSFVRERDADPVLFSAHPFAYLALDHVPPDRFEDFGRISPAALRSAGGGAWVLVEDRFYRTPADEGPSSGRNPDERELEALGFERVAVPDLGVGLAVEDSRHDPSIERMQWALYRKRGR